MVEKIAITAIRDMAQESRIAANLVQLGWDVVFRATSASRLSEVLTNYPSASLFISDDFQMDTSHLSENLYLLRGRTHADGTLGTSDPQNRFELEEWIRSGYSSKEKTFPNIPATNSRVVAMASAEGRCGVTITAINIAAQLAAGGKKTLLVDADQSFHSISSHFEIHNIRGIVREQSQNLFLTEISDRNQLEQLSAKSFEFDFLILDLGKLPHIFADGGRVSDLTVAWIAHSHGRLLVMSSDSDRSISRAIKEMNQMSDAGLTLQIEHGVQLQSALGRGARGKLLNRIGGLSSRTTHLFSRDRKAIEAIEAAHGTAEAIAPKSLHTHEIAQYVDEHLMKG